MRNHYIARFIQRGFAINENANKKKLKVQLFDGEVLKTKLISDAGQLKDIYTEKLDKQMDKDYENRIGEIYNQIRQFEINTSINQEFVMSANDYIQVIKFFVLCWRRSPEHIKKRDDYIEIAKKYFNDNIEYVKEELRGLPFEEIIKRNPELTTQAMFQKFFDSITLDDETVKKTLYNYTPTIIYNTSDVDFILHNSYMSILPSYDHEHSLLLMPISKKLMFALIKQDHNIDNTNVIIPIEVLSPEHSIMMMRSYIIPNFDYLIVNDSNIELVKDFINDERFKNARGQYLNRQ